MEKQNMICISCPMGCHLEITAIEGGGWLIEGNQCKQGKVYARKELTAPTRTLTTTVKVKGSEQNLLPVKTQKAIPKEKLFEAMEVINDVSVQPPIKVGDVVVEDILGTGVNVVATKNIIL